MFTDAQRAKHPRLTAAIEAVAALGLSSTSLVIHGDGTAVALLDLGGRASRTPGHSSSNGDYTTVHFDLPGSGYVAAFGPLSLLDADPFSSVPAPEWDREVAP